MRIPSIRRYWPLLRFSSAILISFSGQCLAQQAAVNTKPHAGMLRFPNVSATQITFVYAGKIWVVPREGGLASPVASPPGAVLFPRFSPDGKTIAFTGNYDGNRDLYTIPVDGGLPFRVTYHPAAEMLCGWTPDGRLLYSSNGLVGQARNAQLFVVSPQGGLAKRLPVPYGQDAALSPDGHTLAYTPSSTNFRTWKRYRGGWAQDIWLFDLDKKTSKRITDWEGTDTLPMWQGPKIYYLSDNGPDHRLNIWRYDTKTGQRTQITKFSDYDLKFPSIGPGPKGGGEIVFQHGSNLELLDLESGKSHAVDVRIPGDRLALRTRPVDASRFITGGGISPSGKRAVLEARGDIWSAPVKDGTPRNLTHSNGSAERDPAWSPDGRWIAYFSDSSGEYELTITQSDGKGETKQLTHLGPGFRYAPTWSPDSKMIAFTDKTGGIFIYRFADAQVKQIDRDPIGAHSPLSWSADSRWITYSKSLNVSVNAIWIASAETNEIKQVSTGMFSDSNPVFDHKGDYIFYASNRAFNPVYEDFGTTWAYTNSQVLLAAPLRADVALPYLPKSSEETWGDDAKKDGKPKTLTATSGLARDAELAAVDDDITGTWTGAVTGEGLPNGSVAMTFILKLAANNSVSGSFSGAGATGDVSGVYVPATKDLTLTFITPLGPATLNLKISGATMSGSATVPGHPLMQVKAERQGGAPAKGEAPPKKEGAESGKGETKAPVKVNIDFAGFESRVVALPLKSGHFGQLAVNSQNQLIFSRQPSAGSEDMGIKLFDITDEKKEEKVVAAGAGAFDISPDGKKLLVMRGQSATVQDASAGAQPEPVVTSGMTVTIEPRVEWKQILDDSWRLERDFFYDPNMHGVDWKAVHNQYARMLEDCSNRQDVGYVIGEMIAELNVGHTYYDGGDIPSDPAVSVGMLGADYELANGAYRISKIYHAAPWDTDTRGPLDSVPTKVKEGDYLLAVNGEPVDTSRDPWAAFVGMADRVVTITVSDKPKLDSSARDVTVKLSGSEANLRYRAWIESNRAYVDKKTGGRVGYIYVPNTGIDGQTDLLRQFISQRNKDALIIDERWNGGGQIPSRFVEMLNRPISNYYALRDGGNLPWPPDGHPGPKCMLINGQAGSGGDAFPWLFRHAGLGKLIGMRTWGGLVGISGGPDLIDGASVTAPSFAFFKLNGTWGIEGHGVDPDIVVVDDPALMQNDADPQLDAGIKEMLDELKTHAFTAPTRPPYPNKTGIGIPAKDK